MKYKRVDDYVDLVQKKYPDISKQDIQKILRHGFIEFWRITKNFGDIFVHLNNYDKIYCGTLTSTKEQMRNYERYKKRILTRFRWCWKNGFRPISDTYYFCIYKPNCEILEETKKKRRRKVTFKNVTVWHIYEEACCNPNFLSDGLILKVSLPELKGFSKRFDELTVYHYDVVAKIDKKNRKIIKL